MEILVITPAYFEGATGGPPERDDLDRVNCLEAGNIGHWQCGWCMHHDKPRFMCGCRVRSSQLNAS